MSRNPGFGIAEERGSDGEEEPGESASDVAKQEDDGFDGFSPG